ncbi:GroES-like protein [Aspergillus saccharolyticus JOP 1030-1]|uniref:GroES-like protein n=1 Tax=Aspergillus saccharolyticus JOP 1030-1 TaxID=1450539 RepID=A0A318ZBD2_9EURO|nr:GroES-like protein [Aspergillus saccharolyticus JOP 1030-1]PYH44619.1 GroES-like protein [Aspergillus saccharolyticus JOP 1030-1]
MVPSKACLNELRSIASADEVLVDLKYSGLCHSDIHAWKGTPSTVKREKVVEGHEGTGIVAAVGSDVEDIKLGDHVDVQWVNKTCGVCEADKRADYLACPRAQMTGYSVGGTFGTCCVIQARHVVRIPKEYPLDIVAPIICTGTTCFRAVHETGVKEGDIDTLAASDLWHVSMRGPMVVEFLQFPPERRDIVHEVQKLTGGGANAAIMVEGTESLLGSAVHLLLRMGQIKSSPYGGTRDQIEEAINIFVREKFYQPARVISLDQMPPMLESTHQEGSHEPSTSLLYENSLLGQATVKIPSITGGPETSTTQESNRKPTFYQESFDVSTFLSYRLEELGICEFLAVPGDTNLVLLDNLLKNPNLRMIGCCNELNAGYAADGYARTSPAKIAVLVVPYVVGALSALNAVAGMLASRKFLHHAPTATNREQALDAYQGVTAASIRLQSAETAVEALDDAISKCLRSSLPIFCEIPDDIAGAACSPPSPLKGLKPKK